MCYTIPHKFILLVCTLTIDIHLQSIRLLALSKNSANSAIRANPYTGWDDVPYETAGTVGARFVKKRADRHASLATLAMMESQILPVLRTGTVGARSVQKGRSLRKTARDDGILCSRRCPHRAEFLSARSPLTGLLVRFTASTGCRQTMTLTPATRTLPLWGGLKIWLHPRLTRPFHGKHRLLSNDDPHPGTQAV